MEKQLKAEFESLLQNKIKLKEQVKNLSKKINAISIRFESDERYGSHKEEEKLLCHVFLPELLENDRLNKLTYKLKPFQCDYDTKYEMYFEQDNIIIFSLVEENRLKDIEKLLGDGELDTVVYKMNKIKTMAEELRRLRDEDYND